MANSITVTPTRRTKNTNTIVIPEKPISAIIEQFKAPKIQEEKVEVLIKEIIRIKPADFSAFKHALEEFVSGWDK